MKRTTFALLATASLLSPALGADILKTDGFTNCNNGNSSIEVQNVDISFDKASKEITFDVAGTSAQEQEVTAELVVTAYGVEVFSQSFDPCADDTKVDQLCPGQSRYPLLQPYILTQASPCRLLRCSGHTGNTLRIRGQNPFNCLFHSRSRWRC